MNYTIHQLRVFVKVCALGSVTKAAEELYLTQPAVSIQLKKLQDEFEVPLTEIIGRRLYVTEFGQKINQLALGILEKIEEVDAAVDDYKGILTGAINIASASTGKYVVPYFLSGFMRKYPRVNISIDVTNKARVIKSLVKNTIDFALVSVIPDGLALDSIPLMDNELNLIAAAHYPLPKKIIASDLEAHTLILREKGSATRDAMQDFLKKNNVKVNRSIQLTSNEAVKQAVRAGLGLSIMPLIGIGSERRLKNLKIIQLQGLPIVSKWNLVHLQKKELSPASKALLQYIDAHKAGIIEEHFPKIV